MLSFFGIRNLEAELFCLAVLSVNLFILLLFEYRQKKLDKKAEESKES